MSSAQIMAIIKQKEAELKKIQGTKAKVEKVYSSMDCITSKYTKAGELMKTAGDIGGKPFDGGKTAECGVELLNITNATEATLNDITARISALDAEIASLYAAYREALAREAAEAARKKMQYKKTG